MSEGGPKTPGPAEVLARLPRRRPGQVSARRRREGARGDTQAEVRALRPARAASAPEPPASAPEPPATRAPRKPRAGSAARPAPKRAAAAKARARAPAKRREPASRGRGAEPGRAPPQGYEVEDTAAARKPVEPPTTAELAGSLIELAAEGAADLARASVAAGGGALRAAGKLLRGG